LAQLLRENYDNRENLARIARRNPKARIGIFHGAADENIPVEMGRELAREFAFVEFFAIDAGHDMIVDWMNR
jgi:pimeloyl-ACP methyl ester carboxylesterase